MKTYSQAVSKTAPTLAEEKSLKKVIHNAVSEENCSRNVLIFGLQETDEEKLCDKVDVIFQQIEEKPHFKLSGLGGNQPTRRDQSKFR